MPHRESPPEPPEPGGEQVRTLAAVDLGSNSFRMVIARLVGGSLQLVDRLREGVRLAECLDAKQRLTSEGRRRALECLSKFGQRVRDIPRGSVRAVGTNTLRKARNTGDLLELAESVLGHPIEVISGQEEARLIYLGACHSLSGDPQRRLVVDIGGGSTESIVGDGFEPIRAESLYMGCVSYTLTHFPGGKISRKRMRRAEIAARLEMRPVKAGFRKLGWQHCAGSSGTAAAVSEILHQNGWSDHGITPAGLRKLHAAVLAAGHVDALALPGLRKQRAKVLPGGLAILSAVFESLGIERMAVSPGALREGVLYDLLGRIRHEDVRDRTIRRFVEQYHVDVAQAQRVEHLVLALLGQVAAAWELDPEEDRHFLSWGASLHEIGLSIAHGGFHKHSAYLIDHCDMPGFSVSSQQMLSLLVRGVRRKFPRQLFATLPEAPARRAVRLCVLLRLAVVLNRSRSSCQMPPLRLAGRKKGLRLELPKGWLDEHPLTGADLHQEARYLAAAGVKLRLGELSQAAA